MNWLVGMQRAQPVAWAALAIALVTVAGFAARKMFGLDFTAITGLLAASITDPPVLAYSHSLSRSDAPSVAYAAVYPLTMLLRIVAVQILISLFCR